VDVEGRGLTAPALLLMPAVSEKAENRKPSFREAPVSETGVLERRLLPRPPAYDPTLPKVPTLRALAVRLLLSVERFCGFWRETVTVLGGGDLTRFPHTDYDYGVLAPRAFVAAPEALF